MRRLICTILVSLACACCLQPARTFAATETQPAQLPSLTSGDNLFVLDTLASDFHTAYDGAVEAFSRFVLPALLQTHGIEAFDRLRHGDLEQELAFEVTKSSHVLKAHFRMSYETVAETPAPLDQFPFPGAQLTFTKVVPQPGHVRIKDWFKTRPGQQTSYPLGRMGIDQNGAITAELTTATHHVHIALDQVDVQLKPVKEQSGKTLALSQGGRQKLASKLSRQPGFRRLLDAKLIRRAANSAWPTSIGLHR